MFLHRLPYRVAFTIIWWSAGPIGPALVRPKPSTGLQNLDIDSLDREKKEYIAREISQFRDQHKVHTLPGPGPTTTSPLPYFLFHSASPLSRTSAPFRCPARVLPILQHGLLAQQTLGP